MNSSPRCSPVRRGGITVVSQSQGGYDEIRDKVNASIAAGEQPAALIAGYQTTRLSTS